jgi:hypothetical protein
MSDQMVMVWLALMALPSFFIGRSRGTLPALVLRGLM